VIIKPFRYIKAEYSEVEVAVAVWCRSFCYSYSYRDNSVSTARFTLCVLQRRRDTVGEIAAPSGDTWRM